MFYAGWLCLLCYTNIVQVSSQPPQYTVKGTKEPPVFYRVQVHHGFHVYNPLARLKTENRYDCILVCSYHRQCETSNFVPNSKFCFLHGSKPKNERQVIGKDIVPSIISILQCDGQDTIPSIDQVAGIPAKACGIPHFQPGDATSDENHRFRRIIGGFISRPYAYPWIGIVLRNNFRICSLLLVTRNPYDKSTMWGVSAAHCFVDQGKQDITTKAFGFLFGIFDLRLLLPYTVYRRASFIRPHPKFDRFNDIAVIKFDRKIAFNFYIRPVCLPEKINIEVSTINNCMFCGWGRTNIDVTGVYADQLMCIDSPVIEFTLKFNSGTLDWKSGLLSVWKSAYSKGPFRGDSGSPLFCYEDERYIARGVTSKGHMTASESRVLSSKISHYMTWIFETMDDSNERLSVSTSKPETVEHNWWNLLNKHVGIPFVRIRNP